MGPKLEPVLRGTCGTIAGYVAHIKSGECSCSNCREANREYMQRRRRTSPEKTLQEDRRYRDAHREQIRETAKIYRKDNADAIKVRKKIWRAGAVDQRRQAERKRRAARLGNGWEDYTEAEVLDLYGTDCYLCGEPIDLSAPRRPGIPGWERGLHIDHLIPISKNGPDTKENVRPTHGPCNLSKHDLLLADLDLPATALVFETP